MGYHEITLSGVVMRFILGGGAVAASYILARRLGGRWGGIFAAFPAVYMAAIITVAVGLPARQGVPLTLQVSKGALVGMLGNVVCAAAASLFIARLGWKKGLANALVVWLVSVGVIFAAAFATGLMR